MDKISSQPSKKGMFAALAGTVLVALCCFTPILVILLGAVGLSVFTPYLDFVLLPALCIMIALSIVSFLRWRKSVANNSSHKDWGYTKNCLFLDALKAEKQRWTDMKTENVSSMGTILTSFLAASCCIGPAIFVIFGTSASFMSNFIFLEPLRPYLLGAAILLLGFSFWKLYLKKQDCSCKEDFRARKIARGIFGVGALAFIISASFQSVLIHLYQ